MSVRRLIAAFLVTVAASAAVSGQEAALSASDYFPVREGLMWRYKIEIRTQRGTPYHAEYEVNCRKISPLAGYSECFRLETSLIGRKSAEILQSELIAWDAKRGVLCLERRNGPTIVPLKPAQVLLPESFKVGDRWSWKGTYKGRRAEMSFSIEKSEELVVGEKHYDCVVIATTTAIPARQSVLKRRSWYGRGVGLVREESVETRRRVETKVTGLLASFTNPRKKAAPTPGAEKGGPR